MMKGKVFLIALALGMTSCASHDPVPGTGDFSDPKHSGKVEPPRSWRASSPNREFMFSVFIAKDSEGNAQGYRIELCPSSWPLGGGYLVTSTLIPIEPGVSFAWRDDKTVIVLRGKQEFLRLTYSPEDGWREQIVTPH